MDTKRIQHAQSHICLGRRSGLLVDPCDALQGKPKEAAMPTTLLTPKAITLFDTWNVRTMYEAGKSAQIAAEMTTYSLSILGLWESR